MSLSSSVVDSTESGIVYWALWLPSQCAWLWFFGRQISRVCPINHGVRQDCSTDISFRTNWSRLLPTYLLITIINPTTIYYLNSSVINLNPWYTKKLFWYFLYLGYELQVLPGEDQTVAWVCGQVWPPQGRAHRPGHKEFKDRWLGLRHFVTE